MSICSTHSITSNRYDRFPRAVAPVPRPLRLHLAPLDAIEIHLAPGAGAAGAPGAGLCWRAEGLARAFCTTRTVSRTRSREAARPESCGRGEVPPPSGGCPAFPCSSLHSPFPGNLSNRSLRRSIAPACSLLWDVNQKKIYSVWRRAVAELRAGSYRVGGRRRNELHASPRLFRGAPTSGTSGQMNFAHFVTDVCDHSVHRAEETLAVVWNNTLWNGVLGEVRWTQIGHEFPS